MITIFWHLTDVLKQEGYEVTGLDYTDSIINSITNTPDLVMLDFLLAGR